jgi:hypothetical protein
MHAPIPTDFFHLPASIQLYPTYELLLQLYPIYKLLIQLHPICQLQYGTYPARTTK